MVCRGHIQNGVVVLDNDISFREGQEVIVLGLGTRADSHALPGDMPHSILDIPSVSLGCVLCVPTSGDDLLGEMLDGRR